MFRAFSMAGFQMTLYGRIWVTPEVRASLCRAFLSEASLISEIVSSLT